MTSQKSKALKLKSKVLFVFENKSCEKAGLANHLDTTTGTITITGIWAGELLGNKGSSTNR